MANLGDIQVELRAKVQNFLRGMEKSRAAITEVTASLRTIGMATGAASAALGAVGVASTVMASKFQAQMTRTAAVAAGGAKGFDQAFGKMSASALEMAGRTQYTGQEVGGAMQFMAMAGLGVQKTMEGIPAVLQLAAASGVGLAESADTVTNIMAGMGLEAKELTDVNNVLIGTFTSSNVSLGELGQAFKMVGPVAKSVGVNLTDVSSAIGLMGNAGIKGTMAGTGLRKMLLSLFSSGKKAKAAMKELRISTEDLSADNGGLENLIRKLEAARERMGVTKFTTFSTDVFGLRSLPKVQALVEQGADAFNKQKEAVAKARRENIAFFLEQKQLDTLEGKWNILKSAVEKAAIAFGQTLFPAVRKIISFFTKLAQKIGNLEDSTKKTLTTILVFTTGILATVSAVTLFAATLGGLSIALMGLKVGLMSLAPMLALIPAPVVALKAALIGLAGILGGQFVYSLVSSNEKLLEGKSMFQVYADAAGYAVESLYAFTETLKNFGAALAHVLSLGFFGDRSDVQRDANYLEDAYSGVEKKAIDLAQEAANVTQELAKLGSENKGLLKEGGALKGLTGQRGATGFQVSFHKQDADIAKRAMELNNRLKKIDVERLELHNKMNKARIDSAAQQKKEMAAKESQRKKEMKALMDQAKADAKASQAEMKTEEQLRKAKQARADAQKTIEGTGASLADDVMKLRAGELGGMVGTMQQYFSTLDTLMDAHSLLGKDIDENRMAFQDLEDVTRMQLINQLKSFKRTQTPEEFAETLKKVNELLDGEHTPKQITADEVKIKAKKVEPFRSDIKGSATNIFGQLFDKLNLGSSMGKGVEGILKGGLGDLFGQGMSSMFGGSGLGSTVGAAIGTAVGGPAGTAAGQVIGGVAETFIKEIPKMFKSIVTAIPNFLTSLIPQGMDSRLASALNSEIVTGVIGAGVVAALMSALVSPIFAGMALVTPALAIFAGLLSLGAQGFANDKLMTDTGEIIAAPQRDAMTRLLDAFSVSLDKVVLAMQPFIESLFPIAGLFDKLVQLIIPFANALGGSSAAAEGLFNVLKQLALVTGYVTLFIADAWENIMTPLRKIPEEVAKGFHKMFKALLNALNPLTGTIGWVLKAFGSLAKWIGDWIMDNDLKDKGNEMIAQGNALVGFNNEIITGLGDLFSGIVNLEVDRDGIRNTVAEIEAMTYEAGQGIFDGLDSVNNSISSVGEQLTNVPSGFKVSLNRWRSILGESTGTGGTFGTNTGVSGTVNDLTTDSYFGKMRNAIYLGVCDALKNCCNCNSSGFSLADVGNAIGSMGIGFGNMVGVGMNGTTTVTIGTLHAANGEQFVDEVQRAIEQRNYRASGNQYSNFGSGGTWRS